MSFIKFKTLLLLILNSILITTLFIFNSNASVNLEFLNEVPLKLEREYKPILVRGAITKEGYYNLKEDLSIELLLKQLPLSKDVDIERTLKLYKNLNVEHISYLFLPSNNPNYLYINFADNKEISDYLNTSLDNAIKIKKEIPYFSVGILNQKLKSLNIETDKSNNIIL